MNTESRFDHIVGSIALAMLCCLSGVASMPVAFFGEDLLFSADRVDRAFGWGFIVLAACFLVLSLLIGAEAMRKVEE